MKDTSNRIRLKVISTTLGLTAALLAITSCGTTCFTLVGGNCNPPAGTNLCITPWKCVTLPNTPNLAVPDDANKTCASAHYDTHPVVDGTEINYGFWSVNSHRRDSYEDLYNYHYGHYPTAAQLAAMTSTDAENWFGDKYVDVHWFGKDYPTDVVSSTSVVGGSVCMPTLEPCDLSAPLFTGYLEDASGHRCTIKPIFFSDTRTGSGDVTVNVQIQQPCAICN